MLKSNLTKEQHDIIKDICNLQIQSLIRVSMEKGAQSYLRKIGIEPDEEEIERQVSEFLKEFDNLKSRPNKLFSLDEVIISLVKHSLLHNDKKYSIKSHREHKQNLWKKLEIRDNFNIIMS